MDDGLVLLRMHGRAARDGRVSTEAFTSMIRRFASTVALFERAFNHRSKRSIDLTVATLRRENPLVVGLHPEARSAAYPVDPALIWTFEEIERIGSGLPPDPRVPIEALDNLISLSASGDNSRAEVEQFQANFRSRGISFDARLAEAARSHRTLVLARMPAPQWFAGVSKGSVIGELRGVTDLAGEREFYIRLPVGQRNVKCVFSEALRERMNQLLFLPVKVSGLLHYNGDSPHAHLIEATDLDPLDEANRPHLLDHRGLFSESYYPPAPELPQ